MADYNDKVVNADLVLPEGDGGVILADDGQFYTENTTTVTLMGNGTNITPLRATIITDPVAGNALTAGPDGLSVGVSPVSDNLLVLAGGKLYVAPPQIQIPISAKSGNVLVEETTPGEEGLYVPAGTKGDTGPQGPKGDPGVGIYIEGILADPSLLPPSAGYQEGDTFVIGTHYWTLVNGQWVDLGDFAGPQGQDGIGLVIRGSFTDTSFLPATGNTEGDTYIIQEQMWVWTGADGWQPVGQVGPTGPTGATGATGPQGPAGPKGDKGEKGDQGPQGIQGLTGPQGVKGDKGDAGNDAALVNLKGTKPTQADLPVTGNTIADAWVLDDTKHVWVWTDTSVWADIGPVQGPKGDDGPTGPQGIQGSKGDQGPQGIQGPTGPDGNDGPQGIPGPLGPKGDTGATGLTGPIGPIGPIGPAGPKGDNGFGVKILGTKSAQAQLPATGVPGDAWIIVPNLWVWSESDSQWVNTGPYVGPKGDKGDQGDAGPQGIQGVQGLQGPKGNDGAAGAEGPKGDTGPTGPTGPAGKDLVAKGTVANEAALPSTGNTAGDYYTTIDTGTGFAWDGTVWVNLGVMRGPTGDPGIQGIQGDPGPAGTAIEARGTTPTEAALPIANAANKGYMYYVASSDATNGQVYVSNGTTWINMGNTSGPTGPQGEMGPGVEIIGKLNSSADLPSTGTLGQGYLIAGDFWGWTGAAYENLGPIQGPKGDQGVQGIQGPAGVQGIQGVKGDQGTLWINFNRNPGPADGRIGDYFINKATLEYFQKTSATVWASLGFMGGGNVYDTAETTPQGRVTGAWTPVVEEAPNDGGYYQREGLGWRRFNRYDLVVPSSTGVLDADVAQVFTVDGTVSKTMSFVNLPDYRAMTFVLVFSGAGASLAWPSTLKWSNGVAPVLGVTRTVVTILWDGVNLTGTVSLTVA